MHSNFNMSFYFVQVNSFTKDGVVPENIVVWTAFVFRPKDCGLKGDDTGTMTIIESQNSGS